MGRSIEQVGDFARIIHLNLQQTVFGRQMRQFVSSGGDAATAVQGAARVDETVLGEAGPTRRGEGDGDSGRMGEDAQSILTAGIQDISNTLVDGFNSLNDILRIILETMYRAMGFKRVVLCIRDAKTNSMLGRFGFGPDANESPNTSAFPLASLPTSSTPPPPRASTSSSATSTTPKIAPRIPDWYRKSIPARTFVLFPLNIRAIRWPDLRRQGRRRVHRHSGKGIVAAAHPAQPGGSRHQAGVVGRQAVSGALPRVPLPWPKSSAKIRKRRSRFPEIGDSGVNALKVAKFCVQLVIALGVTVIAVQSVRDGSAYATLLDQAGMADGACASPAFLPEGLPSGKTTGPPGGPAAYSAQSATRASTRASFVEAVAVVAAVGEVFLHHPLGVVPQVVHAQLVVDWTMRKGLFAGRAPG